MFEHGIFRKALLTLVVMAAAVAPETLLAQQADMAVQPAAIATAASLSAPVGSAVAIPSITTIAQLRAPIAPQITVARWAPAGSVELAVQERSEGRNVAMMGVGVAGLVAGLLIGGDSGMIIATGSAVIGLVGLYHYLR